MLGKPFTLRLPACAFGICVAAATAQQTCPVFLDTDKVTVTIGPADNITSAVQQAASGTTILLKPGTYHVAATVQLTQDNVTLRSTTGNRDDVILDGNGGGTPLNAANFLTEIVAVAASNVTLSDLTIRYARYHGVHAYAPANRGITNLHMRNLRVYDCAEQQIKVNSNGGTPLYWVDNGILECSLVEFVDNSVMENQGTYFYTGGIDVHGGWNWIVRGNLFRNIQRNATLMEAAVHFWDKSRGTLIEDNRFENNYRPITLGTNTAPSTTNREYPDQAGDTPFFDHIDGMIRNNFTFNKTGIHLETGLELTNVIGAEVYHNTVYSQDAPFDCMEYRWPNTRVTLENNLCHNNIMQRDGAVATTQANLENAPASLFVNAATGDLHLVATATQAINQGVRLPAGKADYDFDGGLRDAQPDIGADEFNSAGSVFGRQVARARAGTWNWVFAGMPILARMGKSGEPEKIFGTDGRRLSLKEFSY